jgi:hypothetical protein
VGFLRDRNGFYKTISVPQTLLDKMQRNLLYRVPKNVNKINAIPEDIFHPQAPLDKSKRY